MSLRLFRYVLFLFLALIPPSTYAVDVQFRISVDPGALVGYEGIQLIGYVIGTNPNQVFGYFIDHNPDQYIPLPNPMPLFPGYAVVTPVIPVSIAMDNDGYAVLDQWHVRLIFRLTGSASFMTPDATDIRTRFTITGSPVPVGGQGAARISAIESRPEHAGGPTPSLQFAPSPPVNLVPNVPFTLELRITGVIPPMTTATIPAFILLGSK